MAQWRALSIRIILLTLSAFIGALSVILFMAPFNIAPGGVSGIAVILNKLINTPIGLMIIVLNIPIQYLGYRMLPGGWQWVFWTVFVVLIYSAVLDWLTPFFPSDGLSDNVLLNALFGGITGGISSGLAYRAGGTFGGTSTLALILQKRFGLPMSTTYLYTDMLVMGVAGLVFGWEAALYAIVALFVSGLATDYVLEGPSIIRIALIVTDQPEAVSSAVMSRLGRGVTSWAGVGMYTHTERAILYVTISRAQVGELRKIVQQIDAEAFIVIGQGHTAYGRGFVE